MKAIFGFVSLIATFVILAGVGTSGASFPEWSNFISLVNENPFSRLSFPENLPEPSNITTVTDGLFPKETAIGSAIGENCGPSPISRNALLLDSPGGAPFVGFALSNQYFVCFIFQSQATFQKGQWEHSSRITIGGVNDDTTLRIRVVRWWNDPILFGPKEDSLCAIDTPIIGVPPVTITVTTGTCIAGTFSVTPSESFLVVKYAISTSTETISLEVDGGAGSSFIVPPGFTQPTTNCGWFSPLDCVVDAGQSLLYIGGLLFVFGAFLIDLFVWFLQILVSLFGLIIASFGLIITIGNDAPTPIGVILTGLVAGMSMVVIWSFLSLIRGREPA